MKIFFIFVFIIVSITKSEIRYNAEKDIYYHAPFDEKIDSEKYNKDCHIQFDGWKKKKKEIIGYTGFKAKRKFMPTDYSYTMQILRLDLNLICFKPDRIIND